MGKQQKWGENKMDNKQRISNRALLLSCTVLSSIWAQAALAQDATRVDNSTGDEVFKLREIIVTAQRRTESLQDVPLAVSALDSTRIREAGFRDVEDLAGSVPSLNISALFGTSNPKIFMRGIGNNNFNQTSESKVAVYLDQVYLSAPSGQLFQMYDLERIEILRGPQGTLYGKNATGGAISVYSKLPDDTSEGYLRAGVGNFGSTQLEGAVTVPLSDTLSARVAGTWLKRDGYMTDLGTGQKVNDQDQWAARGILRWRPSESIDISLNIHGGSSDATNNNSAHRGLFDPTQLALGNLVRLDGEDVVQGRGVDVVGYSDPDPDPYVNTFGTETFAKVDIFGASLVGDFDFDAGVLTSVTGFERSERKIRQEGNGSPSTIFTIDWGPSTFESISQEFRFASHSDGAFNWLVGAFGFHERGQVSNFYDLTDVSAFLGGVEAFDQSYVQKTDTLGVFAQASLDFTDRLTFTLGGRINYEKRTLDHQSFATTRDKVSLLPGPLIDLDLEDSWTEWSGRIALDYQVADGVLAFVSANRGFTSGGFNTGAFNDPLGAVRTFDPETLVSYEAGLKSTLLDGRAQLNLTGFIYDYSDLQVFTFTPSGLQFIENASDASVKGVELELQALLFPNFELGGNLSLMESEFQEFIRVVGGVAEDLSGNRLIGAPNFQANIFAKYTIPFDSGNFWIRGDFTHTGNRYFDERQIIDLSSEGSTQNLNASIGYTSDDDSWEVSIWAKNLTDEVNLIDGVSVDLFGYQNLWYNIPRTYGVTLEYHF